jgi:uncharacterized phage-associated protein
MEARTIACTIFSKKEESFMLTSQDIARYFLSLISEESGDLISNLKLQKLVYYAQGFQLALYDTPLFDEEIEAWHHGPVVPGLYRTYKDCGANAIPRPTDIDFSIYNEQTKEILDEVYQVYGQFSAWKLRNMTHDEQPWTSVYHNAGSGSIIPKSLLQSFFKTQLI